MQKRIRIRVKRLDGIYQHYHVPRKGLQKRYRHFKGYWKSKLKKSWKWSANFYQKREWLYLIDFSCLRFIDSDLEALFGHLKEGTTWEAVYGWLQKQNIKKLIKAYRPYYVESEIHAETFDRQQKLSKAAWKEHIEEILNKHGGKRHASSHLYFFILSIKSVKLYRRLPPNKIKAAKAKMREERKQRAKGNLKNGMARFKKVKKG